ncbi:Developmental regulator [Madurella fahalii]|uniref:Developmental regulator n=1 Tax=Madurella fahalii TaxID=1157608 RepID=A0ABQ0GMT4_9PEZI
MPTYLCHGFRWQRRSIRVYVIVQNLDDASPEWIIPARASRCILKSFYSLFDFIPYCAPVRGAYTPSQDDGSDDGSYILHSNYTTATAASDTSRNRSLSRGRSRSQSLSQGHSRSQSRAQQQQQQPPPLPPLPADPPRSATPDDDFSSQSWSAVKLLEEYDPHDLTAVSRPYAYVADYAVRIDLSCSIADEIARYEKQQQQFQQQSYHPSDQKRKPTFLEQLRDQLQRGEEIRWYVVINDDEVRDASSPDYHVPRQQQQPSPLGQQPQIQWYYPPGRQPPTREQVEHHAQYMLQQRIFEGDDRQRIWDLGRKKERKRDRSREQSRGRRGAEYREPRPPIVPDKDYLPPLPTGTTVPLRPKMSLDAGLGRPKTPGGKAGGLRRLFGRNKVDVGYSP